MQSYVQCRYLLLGLTLLLPHTLYLLVPSPVSGVGQSITVGVRLVLLSTPVLRSFIPSCGPMTLSGMRILPFIYPFIGCWIFTLLPLFSHFE